MPLNTGNLLPPAYNSPNTHATRKRTGTISDAACSRAHASSAQVIPACGVKLADTPNMGLISATEYPHELTTKESSSYQLSTADSRLIASYDKGRIGCQRRDSPPKSPMIHLPIDILRCIFFYSIPGIRDDLFTTDRAAPLRSGDMHPHIARRNLLGTCYHWKIVLESTPELWSTMIFNYVDSKMNDYPDRCLFLSETRPLEICFRVEEGAIGDSFRPNLNRLINLMCPHIPRVSRLYLKLPTFPSDNGTFKSDHSGLARGTQFSRLQDLALDGPSALWNLFSFKVGNTLCLKNISLSSGLSAGFRELGNDILASLTCLRLVCHWDRITPQDFSCLSNCKELAGLHFTINPSLDTPEWREPSQIALPNLSYLRITTTSILEVVEFLRYIKATGLKHLSLHLNIGRSSVRHRISPFINVFANLECSSLSRLTLDRIRFSVSDLAEILQAAHSLSRIELLKCQLADGCFRNLMDLTEEGRVLCSNLESVYLHYCRFHPEDLREFLSEKSSGNLRYRSPHVLIRGNYMCLDGEQRCVEVLRE